MSQAINTLEAKVQSILLQEWDPIGIKNIPEAHDEYDRYVADICKILRAHQTVSDVYKYLRWIETEQIGLDGDEWLTQCIAARLIKL
jgi:hypothetical protein